MTPQRDDQVLLQIDTKKQKKCDATENRGLKILSEIFIYTNSCFK